MFNTSATTYSVYTSDLLSSYDCANLQVAETVQNDIEGSKIVPMEKSVLTFDDGRPTIYKEDVRTVFLGDVKFSFYIPDLSSLLFELYKGLDESQEGCVYLNAKVRVVVLSQLDALNLLDYLEAKMEKFKAEEDDWFERYEGVIAKLEASGVLPKSEVKWVN